MTALTLHSGLKGFQLIERLYDVQTATIGGISHFASAPLYLGLEAMAQLAALHVRHLMLYGQHAFLLKVSDCHFSDLDQLEGRYQFQADLLSKSSRAFRYCVDARGPGPVNFCAELIVGTRAYDDRFKAAHLRVHYQNRFKKLLAR